jgi:hypothetical protein
MMRALARRCDQDARDTLGHVRTSTSGALIGLPVGSPTGAWTAAARVAMKATVVSWAIILTVLCLFFVEGIRILGNVWWCKERV